MTAAIRAESLSYRTGRAVLVDAVSVAVGRGEIVGIVGPNGAGKSTLLGLLSGDLRPSEGTIWLDGTSLGDLDHRQRALARSVLPQHRPADIPFTVGEVVDMGRHPLRRSEQNSAAADAAAVADAMRRTDASRLADRTYATLSGGEQARVSMARVLAQSAPVMLLDEPTASLDVAHEERLMRELEVEAERGIAVVAVLHDLNIAARFSTRVLAMAAGRVRAEGHPREVLTDPLLSEIYNHRMRVVPHPFRDTPLVLPDD